MGQLDRDWYHDKKKPIQKPQPEPRLTAEEKAELQRLLRDVRSPFRRLLDNVMNLLLILTLLMLPFLWLMKWWG
jgi:hypothetical protein